MADRYDSMGFKSEHGMWVRAVDYDALREAAGALLREWPNCDARNPDVMQRRVWALQEELDPTLKPHPKCKSEK